MKNIEKMFDKILPILEKITVKIGQKSGFIWSITVKQVFIDSVVNLFALLVLLFGSFFVFPSWFSWLNSDPTSSLGYLGFGVVLLGMILFLIILLQDIITGFFNPEYKALENIINIVRSDDQVIK